MPDDLTPVKRVKGLLRPPDGPVPSSERAVLVGYYAANYLLIPTMRCAICGRIDTMRWSRMVTVAVGLCGTCDDDEAAGTAVDTILSATYRVLDETIP